jgi:cytochrome c-type biogenesis protein CcmH/NrfG
MIFRIDLKLHTAATERRGGGVRHGPNRNKWLLAGGVLLGFVIAGWGVWFRWIRPSTEQLMKRGIAAANRLNHEKATGFFNAVLSRQPDHAQALLLRGQLARESGNLDQALASWQRVPDVPEADGSKARYLEGALHIDKGEARKGERLLLRSVELNASYLPPRELLLQLYVLQQRPADIRQQLLALREYRPWPMEELLLFSLARNEIENADASQPRLEKFVADDPDDIPSRLALAKCQATQGHDDEAVDLLRSGLQRQPKDSRLAGLLAELLLHRSDQPAAAAVLAQANLDENADLILFRSLGTYAADIHDWDRAKTYLERATARDPYDLASAYRLGLVLEAQGRAEEGSRYLVRAKWLDQLATNLELFAVKRHQERVEAARIAVEIARLLSELDRPVEAVLWVKTALEWVPRNSVAKALDRTLVDTALRGAVSTAALAREIAVPAEKSAREPLAQLGGMPLQPAPAARIADNRGAQIKFRECQESAGIDFQYFSGDTGSKYLLESMGGGVAVLDYDGDGWPDLYFTQGARIPPDPDDKTYQDRLFRNLGNGTFEDVTLSAGLGDNRYSQGCVAGDIDNDGDPDLIVANWGENSLFVNNGDGTFVESARQAGLAGEHWHTSLALADFDRDGNLDLYVTTYLLEPLRTCRTSDGRVAACAPRNYEAEQDLLYRNRGDGTFEDVSDSSGIIAPDGKGLGVLVSDLDGDGWPDIYVANDGTANFLFRNTGATTSGGLHFVDEGLTSGAAVSHDGLAQASMGIAAGDFNGDGRPDLYVTNFYTECSALYLNQGNLSFTDAVRAANLYAATRPMLGFGTQAADFDLDGWLDLFATNGHIDDFRFRGEPWKMPPQLFRNRGDGSFADVSQDAGEFFLGEYLGRGVARVDFDRDGKPDIVVSHLDRPAALLRNETDAAGNWLSVELHGVESNRDAIGAVVKVTVAGETRVCEIFGGDGYFASNERRQTIGLGKATVVDRLEIVWPGGKIQRFTQVPGGKTISIVEQTWGTE